jgi:predicted secreted protein
VPRLAYRRWYSHDPLRLLPVSLILALVFVAAAGAHSPRIMAIGQKQNGDSANVNVGDTLVVALPANSATTFNWKLSAVTRTILRPDASGYVPALRPPLAQGAAGVAVFVFKALRTGTTTLKLVYVKTGSKTPAKTYTTKVRVTPST